ncbi:MAG: hypothetical protein ABIG64_06415 [Candidatus Omnitrophota bacterium]
MLKRINILMLVMLTFLASGCGQKVMLASGGYNQHFARYGNYNLVSKNSDLYMEKIDGKETKRLTFTPKQKEDFAFMVSNSGYVAYSVIEDIKKPKKYYLQNVDANYKTREKITEKEFNRYLLNN